MRTRTAPRRTLTRLVYCAVCCFVVERTTAKHVVTCLSSGKNGGLSDVEAMRTHDIYVCRNCCLTRPEEAAAVAAKGA